MNYLIKTITLLTLIFSFSAHGEMYIAYEDEYRSISLGLVEKITYDPRTKNEGLYIDASNPLWIRNDQKIYKSQEYAFCRVKKEESSASLIELYAFLSEKKRALENDEDNTVVLNCRGEGLITSIVDMKLSDMHPNSVNAILIKDHQNKFSKGRN